MIVPTPKEWLLVIRRIGRLRAGALLLVLLQPLAANAAAVGDMAPDFTLPATAGGNVACRNIAAKSSCSPSEQAAAPCAFSSWRRSGTCRRPTGRPAW